MAATRKTTILACLHSPAEKSVGSPDVQADDPKDDDVGQWCEEEVREHFYASNYFLCGWWDGCSRWKCTCGADERRWWRG